MASKSPVLLPLGKNGPLVPRIGFGTMGMGFPCSRLTTPMPDEDRLALLDRAYEIGCTFWDSSDFYVRSQWFHLYTVFLQFFKIQSP
jgi:aryl-alcohol dehydrogenase-like predicted oxidoreductase